MGFFLSLDITEKKEEKIKKTKDKDGMEAPYVASGQVQIYNLSY